MCVNVYNPSLNNNNNNNNKLTRRADDGGSRHKKDGQRHGLSFGWESSLVPGNLALE